MQDFPQEALALLQSKPNTWRQFQKTFGRLPDGFTPPAAPPEAVDFLSKNPDTAPKFQETFGYLPQAQEEVDAPVQEPLSGIRPDPKGSVLSQVGDVVKGGVEAFQEDGLSGVKDFLMQPTTAEERRQLIRGGNDGPLGDIQALGVKGGVGVVSALTSLAEMFSRYGVDPASMARASAADVGDPKAAAEDQAKRGMLFGKINDELKGIAGEVDAALRPEVKRSVESQFVERAADGALQFGEGATDPWWWTGQAIEMGAMMAPGIGAAGKAARVSYGARYAQALAKAGAAKASNRVALRYAEKEATKAAQRAAILAGGTSEGLISGGQAAEDVASTIGQLEEETLLNYAPYAELREAGLSHEAARDKVANDQGLKAGIAVAAVTGLTAIPLNKFIGRWAAKVPVAKSRAGAVAKGVSLEGSQEFVQEGSQQLIQNVSEAPITGQDPWEGVLESAITGAVVGGALGGGLGAATGAEASTKPETSSGRILEKRLKEYNAARDNLAAAQGFASDPNVKITKADIDAAREEYRLASVNFGQELLASGSLDKTEQKAVAEAIEEARALGVKIPEKQTHVDEKQLSKANDTGAGQGEAKAGTEGAPAKEGDVSKPEALSATQTERLDILNRVANAESVTEAELNTLVKEKLANVSKQGRVVLLPSGRRQRTELAGLNTKAEKAADTKTEKPSVEKSDKSVQKGPDTSKKATDQGGYTDSDIVQPGDTKIDPAKEPAEKPAHKDDIEALSPENYGTLERLATGKVVDKKEVAPLVQAGLVAERAEGKFTIRPRGRREMKAFQDTRQTALERAHEPVIEGNTLTSPKVKAKRKEAQVEAAHAEKAAAEKATTDAKKATKFKKAETAAAIAKRKQEEAAVVERGDQALAVELAKATEPTDDLSIAYMKARAEAKKTKGKAPDKAALSVPQSSVSKVLKTARDASEDAKNDVLRFRHFSNLNEKEVDLDPGFQGTGIKGRESRRGGQKVLAMYAEDHPDSMIEPGLNSKTEYSVEVNRADIYDANDDPNGFVKQASEDGQFDMSEFESLVKKAGFKGYRTPQADGVLRGQARLFTKVKARRVTAVSASVVDALRSEPLSVESVKEAVADVENDFGFTIHVIKDYRSFPASVQALPAAKEAQAVFFPTPMGGEVYLSAEHTGSADSARIAAIHEIVGHYGLRAVLGTRYAETMDQIFESFSTEVIAAGERNKIDLTTADAAQLLANRRAAAEELVAYSTEKVLGGGTAAELSIWEQVVQFVRNALRKMRVLRSMNHQDIQDLILRSRDYVRSGREQRVRAMEARAIRAGHEAYTPNFTPLLEGQPLIGMPTSVEIPGRGNVQVGPYQVARAVAEKYMLDQGIPYRPVSSYLRVNKDRAKRIAAAFDAMKHDPTDPKVAAAYDAMIKETLMQYRAIKETGLKVEFIADGMTDPYAASPRLATQDVVENNHLWVFPTDNGFGSSEFDPKGNPLLTETEEVIGDRRLLANDVFRIVHDYFGHVKEGVGFRADGEENAWRSHASMYTPLARAAMTTETRGQNSWVNFGPHGEQNRLATGEKTVYADQKIGLLPEEFWKIDEEIADEMESAFGGRTRDFGFDNWFAGSQVVDSSGAPLKMFHGTLRDFKAFDTTTEGMLGEASYFTSDPNDAGQYAKKLWDDAQPRLIPVFLSLKNPYHMEGLNHKARQSLPTRKELEAQGHDGIIVRKFLEDDIKWALAFHPTQIKSAYGNAGTYDPSNPDIAFTMPERLSNHLTDAEMNLIGKKQVQKIVDLFDKLPSDQEIAAVALAGAAKRGWYKKSAQAMSDLFEQDAPRFAALMAALSPQTSVETNLRNALNTWVNWTKAGRPTSRNAIFKIMMQSVEGDGKASSVLPAWVNNTVRALSAPDALAVELSGPKVTAFAANLRGEMNAVTLDKWMANFALVDQQLFKGKAIGKKLGGENSERAVAGPGYLAFTARVRQAAARLTQLTGDKWTPAEVQETVWSWAKALTEYTEAAGPLFTAREIIQRKELTDDFINATPDFATLLQKEEFATTLTSGGYGGQLDRLRAQQAERAASGQAAAAAEAPRKGDRGRLITAAERLDKYIVERREAAGVGITATRVNRAAASRAAFTLGGVATGGNKDLESFLGKIGAKPRTLKQRYEELTNEIGDRLNVALFDHFYGIKRAEQLAGVTAADSGYISARLSTSAASLMRATLEAGYPVWDDGAPNVAGEKGFFEIIKPLGDNVNTWLAWMVAKRSQRLMTEDREHLFTAQEISAALQLGQNNPAFQQAANEYTEFKTRILDFAEEAGIINPDTRAVWDNADYIPFYRLMENGEVKSGRAGGGLGFVKNQIKKLKGGEQNLGDPLENIMRNWSNLIEASLKAHAARITVDNLDGTGLVTPEKIMPFTPASVQQFMTSYPTLVQNLQSIGITVQSLTPQVFRGIQQMLTRKPPEGHDTITVWRDGKQEGWIVHDSLLFRSLQAINPNVWSSLMNVLRVPKRFLTETITIVPEFSVKNIWRDMWSVLVQGRNDKAKIPIIPVVDTAKGLVEFLKKGDTAISMMAGGGSFEGTGYNPLTAAESARRAGRRAGVTHGIIDTPMKAYLMYRDVLGAAENAHRVSVYQRVLKTGATRKEALYEARDLMDFSLRGNAPLVRFLVETVPFWGARVAGLSTLGRRIVSDPWGVLIRGSLLTMASLAYVGMNFDDERYKGLTPDQKNMYWHVWVGDMHYRIPKPFEVGTIFGTIPEAMMDAALTNADEPDAAMQSLKLVGHAFAETLDLSPQVAAVWPVLELAINKNTFTGAPVLTLGDQGVLPEDQDSPSVRATYRMLARAMPDVAPDALRSPKQLQHLARGYIGTAQDYVLIVTDKIARAAAGEPKPSDNDIGETAFFKAFADRGPQKNTKYMNEMYRVADEAEKVYRSLNKVSENTSPASQERVEELLESKGELLDVRKTFRKAVDQVSGIRAQQRDVQLSGLTPEEKKELLDDMNAEVNEIAKSVWDLRPGGKFSAEVAASLMGVTKQEQVSTLNAAGLPASAALIESLPKNAPAGLLQE